MAYILLINTTIDVTEMNDEKKPKENNNSGDANIGTTLWFPLFWQNVSAGQTIRSRLHGKSGNCTG